MNKGIPPEHFIVTPPPENPTRVKVKGPRRSGGSLGGENGKSVAVAEYPICPRCGRGEDVKEWGSKQMRCTKCGFNFAV
jgi:hypothetical protein